MNYYRAKLCDLCVKKPDNRLIFCIFVRTLNQICLSYSGFGEKLHHLLTKTNKVMTRNYELQAQRRARKIADIKEMFYRRMAEENKKQEEERMKLMDIYEEVAYHFYLSDTAVRAIIAGRR